MNGRTTTAVQLYGYDIKNDVYIYAIHGTGIVAVVTHADPTPVRRTLMRYITSTALPVQTTCTCTDQRI